MSRRNIEPPDRNLALDLVRVTEAAAMAAGRWVGRGDKDGGDAAAVDAMRALISTVPMAGRVVIGEGEKDNAPMLYNGERVGSGDGPACDVAVAPIDGTTLMAKGQPNAVSVIAVTPQGAMFDPTSVFYMDKIATGPEAVGTIDVTAPVSHNIAQVAKAKGMRPEDVTVVLLDRPRHSALADEIRSAGARIRFISDGDVAGAIMTGMPDTGIDLLMGIGGTPEGVIAAAAMKCLGGEIQGRLHPLSLGERERALAESVDLDRVLSTDDLVSGDEVFFCATGITDGELLPGVRYHADGLTTTSVVMRFKSGTVRELTSHHRPSKLRKYSAVDYDHTSTPGKARP